MTTDLMELWAIYDHPIDYPDGFVARLWVLPDVNSSLPIPTINMFTGDTLDEVRALLPPGLQRIPRMVNDDPKIVEVWL